MFGAQVFPILLILTSGCLLCASSIDPGHDGYIINCYLDNFKSAIRRQIGEEGFLKLPDIDFCSGKFYGFRGRLGTFMNAGDILRVDEAKLTPFGDSTTNIKARFYLPNAHLHYEVTTLHVMKVDLDVRVLINAVDVDFNLTISGNECSIQHDPSSLYVSMLEGSNVKSYIAALHNRFLPSVIAEYVELAYEALVELFVDTGLIFFVRAGLADYIYNLLVSATNNMDFCDIFDGPAQCGSLTF